MNEKQITRINGVEILTVERDGEVYVPINQSAKPSASTSLRSIENFNRKIFFARPLSL